MKMAKSFPCTKCGACCRRAHSIGGFLYADHYRGGCIMLINNECNIYNGRPPICSIDEMKEATSPNTTQKAYYKETAEICNIMIRADRMDEAYLVNLKQFED